MRSIEIDAITRIEGDGKIDIFLRRGTGRLSDYDGDGVISAECVIPGVHRGLQPSDER